MVKTLLCMCVRGLEGITGSPWSPTFLRYVNRALNQQRAQM